MTDGQTSKICEDAYVFAYPMLENYRTLFTQACDPKFGGYIGGFDRYRHYSRPYTPSDSDIVTPNNDTVYSWAWLDLRREPIVMEIPDIDASRYNIFQWFDLYTYNFATPGSRLNGTSAKTYLFAKQGWSGSTPDAVDEVFFTESDFVGTLTRTSINGPDDIARVQEIEHGYRFTPLSEFVGDKPPPPAPQITFPTWDEDAVRTPAYITYVNFLLDHIAINAQDEPALNEFAKIGIGAGLDTDVTSLDNETRDAIQSGIDSALAKLTERVKHNEDNIGLFGPRQYLGTDYEARAVGAMIGLYGLNETEAVYFSYQTDADGNELAGSNTYKMKFSEPPPVNLFWSLTMYNLPQRLLVDNPIDRYSFGDRTEGILYDSDGGLEITLSRTDPGSGTNWLPTPDGNFFLVMRMYAPKEPIINKTWPRPQPALEA